MRKTKKVLLFPYQGKDSKQMIWLGIKIFNGVIYETFYVEKFLPYTDSLKLDGYRFLAVKEVDYLMYVKDVV
jgi:hypothetical protein